MNDFNATISEDIEKNTPQTMGGKHQTIASLDQFESAKTQIDPQSNCCKSQEKSNIDNCSRNHWYFSLK